MGWANSKVILGNREEPNSICYNLLFNPDKIQPNPIKNTQV